MLVRASAISTVELIKSAEAVDTGAAALWLHMALFDTLGEMIEDARPEITGVWKAVVATKSDHARRILVRQAVERRVDGDEIDDVVKAAAGLSLVRGYVAKTESDETRRAVAAHERRDVKGRFARTDREKDAYDVLEGLTTRNPGLKEHAEGVADQLTGSGYDRMRVLGNGLVATGALTGNAHLAAAGTVTRVAAEVGPSAEDVLGTHLRRVAYRYRGTEKRPDPQLLRETKETQAYVAGLSATPRSEAELRYQATLTHQLESRQPGEWGKGSVAYRMAQASGPGQHVSEDQIEMRSTGDVAAAYLMRQLPSKDEAVLSQEAGRTPPSVGVIIDRDGDVVSEAMGYQGDHYVPFDLKNLKRLHGGSYVRTRALGGPTSEDIYTGLLSGARQMQVVSRSGVFTVEFDPDLRGGRRYSDKAHQMVDRYARLLDVVERGTTREGERIYTNDISEDRKREIKQEALGLANYDRDEAKAHEKKLLDLERIKNAQGYTDAEVKAETEAQLDEWVRNQQGAGKSPSATEIGRMREQVTREVREHLRSQREQNAVRELKLNAEGYYRAMQSLHREFPYYIRGVDYESLRDFEERRRTSEPGAAPLDFGAPTAGAKRTHVRRQDLLPGEQAAEYKIKQRPGRSKATDDGTDTGDTATVGGPRTPQGGAPGGAAGATFAEMLKSEQFQNQVSRQADVLRVVNQIGSDGSPVVLDLNYPKSGQMDREWARSLGSDEDYVKWLVTPGNTITHGDINAATRFLIEDADSNEIRRTIAGLQAVSTGRGIPATGAYSPEKIGEFTRMLGTVEKAKNPFAPTGGSAVLHKPDRTNPKPYAFPEVTRVMSVESEEKFDKAQRISELEGHTSTEAMEWARERDDERIGAQLRLDVLGYEAAVEWGKKRLAAKRAGADAADYPQPPADTWEISDGASAETVAEKPEDNEFYKKLRQRQLAWAWVYTKRLREQLRAVGGGGETPKVERQAIEGPKSARLDTSSRRVVWHSPDDPLSQALAKRLRQRRT